MIKNKKDKLAKTIQKNIGISVMTVAAIVGMLELPDHNVKKVITPIFVSPLSGNIASQLNNPIRRDKEEMATEYVSYSESQRTPGRFGKY